MKCREREHGKRDGPGRKHDTTHTYDGKETALKYRYETILMTVPYGYLLNQKGNNSAVTLLEMQIRGKEPVFEIAS